MTQLSLDTASPRREDLAMGERNRTKRQPEARTEERASATEADYKLTPIISIPRRPRQEDCCKFEAALYSSETQTSLG